MSLADRLAAAVAAFPPVREHTDKEGAPYRIVTVGDKVRIELTNADGDRLTGSGATVEEALAALEARL